MDRLYLCPGRIGTVRLMDQASIFVTDIYEDWLLRVSRGQADGESCPDLPYICEGWVQRWRQAYGVTYRTVNLRYKLSRSKRDARLKVFWSNVLRVRLLHECLYGKDGIDFVSVDQKPLYFCSSLAAKTLAPRGAKKVNVKECVADSRERFTLMTSCPSWTVDSPPGLAVLFRHSGVEPSRVCRGMDARSNGLVQWAPKGSYRLLHVLEYLKWAICEGHAVPNRPPSIQVPALANGEEAAQDGDAQAVREAQARARATSGLPAETRHLVVVLD